MHRETLIGESANCEIPCCSFELQIHAYLIKVPMALVDGVPRSKHSSMITRLVGVVLGLPSKGMHLCPW
eukprot:COSAG02_NODE_1727_length_11182_cov_40.189209_3_plen_69_part_00